MGFSRFNVSISPLVFDTPQFLQNDSGEEETILSKCLSSVFASYVLKVETIGHLPIITNYTATKILLGREVGKVHHKNILNIFDKYFSKII